MPPLAPKPFMMSNSSFQKALWQKPGTTARSRQMSRMVRPIGRRRTWRAISPGLGMKGSGFVPAGEAGEACCALGRAGEGLGGLLGLGAGLGRLLLRRGGAALDEFDVFACGGAGEEDTLQDRGAQHASVEVGEDGGEVGGAEAGRDGAEVFWSGGALAEGVDQVAAVADEDVDGVENDRDVVGYGFAVVPRGDGKGGDGRGWFDWFHSVVRLPQAVRDGQENIRTHYWGEGSGMWSDRPPRSVRRDRGPRYLASAGRRAPCARSRCGWNPRWARQRSLKPNRRVSLIRGALKQAGKRGHLQHRIQCRQGEDPAIRIPDNRPKCIIDPGPADAT